MGYAPTARIGIPTQAHGFIADCVNHFNTKDVDIRVNEDAFTKTKHIVAEKIENEIPRRNSEMDVENLEDEILKEIKNRSGCGKEKTMSE